MTGKHKEHEKTYTRMLQRSGDRHLSQPEKYVSNAEHTHYLIIRHSEKDKIGYTVNHREDVVEAELETAG